MTPVSNRFNRANSILGKHKAVFIALAFLTWISPPASLVLLSEGWTPLALILGPALFFPPVGLMVVLSIVAIRHYHPLMWLSFISVATTIIWMVWLETPS
ncbi:hypothetical protein [Hoeflea poritis]|uniref:Uncharacterized protein n=1 Tax=Hoeflea poritis TaxID=2993659 RepID=A0ABT4VIP3_9HYPH|nr:hypothetical protein [Hoeflea poritis]MDA4843997.1 hypothetical protein [Hoeflea poritis]